MNDMKEIDEEIKQTLNLMQTDINEGARDELQCHIVCLLEIKRNELHRRLTKRLLPELISGTIETVTYDQHPYKGVGVKLDG